MSYRGLEEALEVRLHVLEPEVATLGKEGPEKLDSEVGFDGIVTDDGRAPALQAQPTLKMSLEHNQPLAPGDGVQGPPLIYYVYYLYPHRTERIRKKGRQRPGEPILTLLLRLWDDSADSLQLSLPEMEKLASIMTHPSLWQQLQISHHLGAGQGGHSLIE